jgi:hypothetical protein
MDAGVGPGDADPVGVRGQEVWCGAGPPPELPLWSNFRRVFAFLAYTPVVSPRVCKLFISLWLPELR